MCRAANAVAGVALLPRRSSGRRIHLVYNPYEGWRNAQALRDAPDIADALTKLLRQIELGTTADADLRNQAQELIRGSKIRSRDRQSGQSLSLRDQGG